MGFSTSGATAVIFLGLLIAIGTAYPALESATDRRTEAIDARDQRALDVRNTALEITNVSYDEGTGNATVNVTNTGSTTLSVAETDLLVDGEYRTDDERRVEGSPGRESWLPGERLTLSIAWPERPDRVKVVAENGVADTETGV